MAAAHAGNQAWSQTTREPVRRYARALLVDVHGEPFKASSVLPRQNYVFHYPYAATPCFLLNLGKPLRPVPDLALEDGRHYALRGGVGAQASIVAFSAICAHKLAYPTRDITFIRFQTERSPKSDAERIHCCADHSVYDPAQGARVVRGPAKQPLAAIALDYDGEHDTLYALGTVGGELFDAFFTKYEFKLALEYGAGRARQSVGDKAVVREMAAFCRQTVEC